jgi:hypothetical protein
LLHGDIPELTTRLDRVLTARRISVTAQNWGRLDEPAAASPSKQQRIKKAGS